MNAPLFILHLAEYRQETPPAKAAYAWMETPDADIKDLKAEFVEYLYQCYERSAATRLGEIQYDGRLFHSARTMGGRQ